jgi:hypothetical protein
VRMFACAPACKEASKPACVRDIYVDTNTALSPKIPAIIRFQAAGLDGSVVVVHVAQHGIIHEGFVKKF